jgi:hypothetical protein
MVKVINATHLATVLPKAVANVTLGGGTNVQTTATATVPGATTLTIDSGVTLISDVGAFIVMGTLAGSGSIRTFSGTITAGTGGALAGLTVPTAVTVANFNNAVTALAATNLGTLTATENLAFTSGYTSAPLVTGTLTGITFAGAVTSVLVTDDSITPGTLPSGGTFNTPATTVTLTGGTPGDGTPANAGGTFDLTGLTGAHSGVTYPAVSPITITVTGTWN